MNKRRGNYNYATEKTDEEILKIVPHNLFPRNAIEQRAVFCHKYFVTRGCVTIRPW